jgi:CheY-like chemotaxis protein
MRSGISTTVSTLVIDNDTPTSSVLGCALVGQGYLVAQARSCGEAIRRILHTPVDLVLLDTEATGFDGMETCRRLHLAVPQVSIVVITVCDCEEERVQALDAGADDCIARPFSFPLFLARLHTLIRLRRLRAAQVVVCTRDNGVDRTVRRSGAQFRVDPAACTRPRGDDWLEGRPDIADMSLRRLRTAIRNGEVSFPSQVPIFGRQSRADIQWRLVQLYFVRGWRGTQLATRYRMSPERIRQLLSQWARRAIVLGYLQEIPGADSEFARAARPGVDT